MKFIFIVQGEGRGHLTQAISLFKILSKNGHIVTKVVVGKSKRRELPKFFRDQIDSPIVQLESPNFVTDRKSKSVQIFKTLIVNLYRLRRYIRSVNKIDEVVKEDQPDVIVNFYDFLSGLFFMLKKSNAKHIAIAHQFLLDHPAFEFPKGRFFDKFSLQLGNKLASFRAERILALSFQRMDDYPKKRMFTIPPLLREEIKTQVVSDKDHFLIYMVNHGYGDQVKDFHKRYPDVPLQCFWDNRDAPEVLEYSSNLTFHQLNDKKFIEFMSSCKGYLTTAGFESVCEAMYMGKPTLMVPVKGHYEQSCNALDAKKAGAGISSEEFDLKLLLDYIPSYIDVKSSFKEWCSLTEELFIKNLVANDH